MFYPLLKLARLRVVRDSCTAYLHCRHHVQCCLLYEAPSLNRKLNFKFAADVSSAQWYFNKQSSRTPFHIANSNILNSTTTTTVAIVAWIITVRECNDVLLTMTFVHCTFPPPKKNKIQLEKFNPLENTHSAVVMWGEEEEHTNKQEHKILLKHSHSRKPAAAQTCK